MCPEDIQTKKARQKNYVACKHEGENEENTSKCQISQRAQRLKKSSHTDKHTHTQPYA